MHSPACLCGQGMLERGGGLQNCVGELLNNCSRDQAANFVSCHNAADTSIGLLQRCETTQPNCVHHVIRNGGHGNVLGEPAETHGVPFALQHWTGGPRKASRCSPSRNSDIFGENFVVQHDHRTSPLEELVRKWFSGCDGRLRSSVKAE